MAKNGKIDAVFGLQWHVTDECDQRCSHCYIWREKNNNSVSKTEMDLEKCVSIVDDFSRFCKKLRVTPVINITGGDPLLYRFIWGLLEYLKEKKIFFRILGNPFHLNDEICLRLLSLGCKSYQMSLDGLKKNHDAIRKLGSFDATLKAIAMLKKAGIRTVIMSTVSRLNYQEMFRLVDVVVKNKVDVYDFARYCPDPKGKDSQLTPCEYKSFLSKMWRKYQKFSDENIFFPLKDNLWVLWLYEKGLFQTRKENIVFEGCGCGIKHLTLLPNGIVYACRRFKSPVGDILRQSFEEIFLGGKIDKYRKIEKMDGCGGCELLNYCRGCHAVSYGVSGDFFARDPQCWKFF